MHKKDHYAHPPSNVTGQASQFLRVHIVTHALTLVARCCLPSISRCSQDGFSRLNRPLLNHPATNLFMYLKARFLASPLTEEWPPPVPPRHQH